MDKISDRSAATIESIISTVTDIKILEGLAEWISVNNPRNFNNFGLHDFDLVILFDQHRITQLFKPLLCLVNALGAVSRDFPIFVYPTFRLQQFRKLFSPSSFPVHLTCYASIESMVSHEGLRLAEAVSSNFRTVLDVPPDKNKMAKAVLLSANEKELFQLVQLWIETVVLCFGSSFPLAFRIAEARHKFRYITRTIPSLTTDVIDHNLGLDFMDHVETVPKSWPIEVANLIDLVMHSSGGKK